MDDDYRTPENGYIGKFPDLPTAVAAVKQAAADLPTCDPAQPNDTSPWPHDYEETGEEYGSLAEGGSYVVLRCRRCERAAFRPMAD